MKTKTFEKGMAILMAVFPNRNLSTTSLEIYQKLLEDLSDDNFMLAISRICGEVKELYPDTNIVALIRQYAAGGNKEDLSARAIMAWEAVRVAIQQQGHYQSVSFDDPVIHLCIQALGGWIDLCTTEINELVWREKKFKEIYPVFAVNNQKYPPRLIGQIEKENRLNGYDSPIELITCGKDTGETKWSEFNPIPEPILIETGVKTQKKIGA